MEEYAIILFRTIFLYLLILIVFRLMGKREVGELGLSDIVVYVIIAEVASFSLDDPTRPLGTAVFPIVILLLIQYTNARIVLKHKPLRDLIDGDPSLIIEHGELKQEEMARQRYNLDDLLQQLREQGVTSLKSVSYAFLEQSGKLSIFYEEDAQYILPLVLDGYIDHRHLMLIKKDETWLKEQLALKGHYDISQIFYCGLEKDEWVIQLKARK